MKRVLCTWLALLLLLAAPATRAQEKLKPIFLLVLPSYDEFMDDVDYIGKLSGQPQVSKRIEQMLARFTLEQGLAGLDKTKPCGAAMFLDGGQPAGVFFVPVTNLKKLLETLEPWVGVAEESKDHEGLLELSVSGQSIYVKEQNGWAWFSHSPDLLGKVPKAPQGWIGPLAEQYDFAIQLRVQNVPEIFRQMGFQFLRGLAEMSGRRIKEPELRQLRRQAIEFRLKQLEEVVQSVDRLTLGYRVDRKKRNVALECRVIFLPDSPMGRLTAGYALAPSQLAAFSPSGAIVRCVGALTVGDPVRQYYSKQWEQERRLLDQAKELMEKAPPEDKRAQRFRKVLPWVEGYMKFAQAALNTQRIEAAFAVENQQGKLFASGALLMPGGPDFQDFIDRALSKLAQVAGDDVELQRDVARVGSVRFYRLKVDCPKNHEKCTGKKEALFGTQAGLVLAAGPDGVYWAFGSQALEQLQRRVAAVGKQPRTLKYAGYMEFALRPLLQFIKAQAAGEEQVEKAVTRIIEALPEGDRDKVRLRARLLPNGWQVELVFDEGTAIAGNRLKELIRPFTRESEEEAEAPEF